MGTVDQSPTPTQGDDVKRRAAIRIITAMGAGAAVPPGPLDELLSGIKHVSATSGAVDLDRWERVVWEYGHRHSITRPSEASLEELTADIIDVGQLLDQPHQPVVSAGLLRVSAALSGLLAMHFDAIGDRRAARVTWGVATGAADSSGDRDLSVWVRAKEADGALWGGAPRPVVAALADQAIAIAKGNPSHGLARAYTVRADLWAEMGDVSKAHASLNQLTETLNNLPGSFAADPIAHVGGRFLRWHEGYVYTLTGNAKAPSVLDEAVNRSPAGWYGTGSLNLMRAIGLVKERDINGGLAQALQVIHDAPTTTDTATRNRLIGHILAAVPAQAQTLPAARDLRALTAGI
ncbi:XRE family transcriptional regulator [Actinomadura rubrisoli]|uniref:XRE family transcriptional regulator n=1 Tax=Actinomadura rubrisoli TaxID=2530368 RepID=A0A4R5C6E5_9ACTN|nr:XRE family transcriptional regulator [Actinomadura rubrisoli]TDD95341.1 XRE family transcriptional regulator [Actinomadura rubrisoli]